MFDHAPLPTLSRLRKCPAPPFRHALAGITGPDLLTAALVEQVTDCGGNSRMDNVADLGAVFLGGLDRHEGVADAVADHRRFAEEFDRIDRSRHLTVVWHNRGILRSEAEGDRAGKPAWETFHTGLRRFKDPTRNRTVDQVHRRRTDEARHEGIGGSVIDLGRRADLLNDAL